MAIERKERLHDGSFSEPKKIGRGETDKEKLIRLEEENAIVIYDSMMKGSRIADLEAAHAQSDAIQSEILYALMNGGIL